MNPKIPRPKDTKIKVHIKIFFRSAQSKVLEIIPIMIIRPPIVGVPDFFIIWSIGPSCLIGPLI